MTTPTSAPPPTSSRDFRLGKRDGLRWTITWLHARARSMNDPKATAILNSAAFDLGNEIREGRMPSIPEDRDGWNAALAAQPPTISPRDPDVLRASLAALGPSADGAVERDLAAAERTPPKPGDAEGATEAWREAMRGLFGKVPSSQYYAVHTAFKAVADLLAAAQSALAASQAEIERRRILANEDHEKIANYAERLAASQAEVARLTAIIEDGWSEERVKRITQDLYHIPTRTEKDAAAVIEASDVLLAQSRELARLRAPAATEEDRERAIAYLNDITGSQNPEDHATKWFAAARAQGVREERERWMDCAILGATMEGPKLQNWNRSMLDRLYRSALAAPETKEEKHDGP